MTDYLSNLIVILEEGETLGEPDSNIEIILDSESQIFVSRENIGLRKKLTASRNKPADSKYFSGYQDHHPAG